MASPHKCLRPIARVMAVDHRQSRSLWVFGLHKGSLQNRGVPLNEALTHCTVSGWDVGAIVEPASIT